MLSIGRKYFLLIMVSLLNACATTPAPEKQYEAVKVGAKQVAMNNLEALKYAVPITLLPGQDIKTKISLKDPVIQFGNIQSNYKIFTFHVDRKLSYCQIDLRSLSDPFGFNKYILDPVAYLFDVSGNVISHKSIRIEQSYPTWTLPGNIHVVWEGMLQKQGTYYFLVTADNRMVGHGVAIFWGSGIVPVKCILKSYPTGTIIIRLSLKQTSQLTPADAN